MTFQQFKAEFQARLRNLAPAKNRIPDSPAAETADPKAALLQAVTAEKYQYIFGFEWRFYSDRKDLKQTLNAAKREGYTHYITTNSEDLVGIGRIDAKKSTHHFAAALQLSDKVSVGGLELFIFKISDEVFTLVALNDSRPENGFEKSGSRSEILALAGEFQMANADQNIRQAGNTGALEHEEHIKLFDAFARPESFTRIKKIPDYKLLIICIVGALVLAGISYSSYRWVNKSRQKEADLKRAQQMDPNFIYENEINSSLKGTGLPAQIQLDGWRSIIFNMPLSRQGWVLNSITCQAVECKLDWIRNYGSYEDFYSKSPANEIKSSESQEKNNPASSSIQTMANLPPRQEITAGIDRDKLLPSRKIQQKIASLLQDISLLKNSNVVLENPEVFPAGAGRNVSIITKPVVRGSFEITHELWSLADLNFPLPALTLESLNISKEQETGQWTYTLKGYYYAKGKEF